MLWGWAGWGEGARSWMWARLDGMIKNGSMASVNMETDEAILRTSAFVCSYNPV